MSSESVGTKSLSKITSSEVVNVPDEVTEVESLAGSMRSIAALVLTKCRRVAKLEEGPSVVARIKRELRELNEEIGSISVEGGHSRLRIVREGADFLDWMAESRHNKVRAFNDSDMKHGEVVHDRREPSDPGDEGAVVAQHDFEALCRILDSKVGDLEVAMEEGLTEIETNLKNIRRRQEEIDRLLARLKVG